MNHFVIYFAIGCAVWLAATIAAAVILHWIIDAADIEKPLPPDKKK